MLIWKIEYRARQIWKSRSIQNQLEYSKQIIVKVRVAEWSIPPVARASKKEDIVYWKCTHKAINGHFFHLSFERYCQWVMRCNHLSVLRLNSVPEVGGDPCWCTQQIQPLRHRSSIFRSPMLTDFFFSRYVFYAQIMPLSGYICHFNKTVSEQTITWKIIKQNVAKEMQVINISWLKS